MGKNVDVFVGNRVTTLGQPYNYDKLIPFWQHEVQNWFFIKKKFQYFEKKHGKWKVKYRWDGKIKFLKHDRLPTGLFWATYRDIEKALHKRFRIHNESSTPVKRKSKYWLKSEGKYSFQNDCVDVMLGACNRGMGGLILNATGSGKTRIAAMFASRVDCDILFVVDQLNLLEQAKKDIGKHLGEKIGKVGESKFHLERVTVATRQTLAKHTKDYKFMAWFKSIQVVFIDEIHEQMNKSNFKIMQAAKPYIVFGLTATLKLTQKPTRLKAWSLTGPVLYSYPLLKGMEDQVLSRGVAVFVEYDNSIRETGATDRSEAYVDRIVTNEERNHLVGRLVKRAHKKGKYVIVLVDRIKHLERLSRRLDQERIKHKIAAGQFKGEKLRTKDRARDTEKFEQGKFRVILANKVFKKGVDIKRLDVVINAAGLGSQNDAVQVFGRGIRKHADKFGLLYFDISDTDRFDAVRKYSKKSEKRNWFSEAAKKRKRALKKVGIPIVQTQSNHSTRTIFKLGEKELSKLKRSLHG